MFKTIWRKAFLLAVGFIILASPAIGGTKTAGERIDDSTVSTRTKAALVENKNVSAGDINVEVYKGTVQLSGFVDSGAKQAAALATAAQVEGATRVLDAIVIMPGSRTMGETVDDKTIQTRLKTGLTKGEGFSSAVSINTDVWKGHVLLAGFVDSEEVKAAAGEVARAIPGVKEVHNLIAVQP